MPRSASSKPGPSRSRVSSVIRTLSASSSRVAASTRAATLTGSPMTEKLSLPAPPIAPATTRPAVDPDADPDPLARATLLVHGRDHLAGGADRAVGVVVVVLGRAEDRQQPVADELVDVAAVAGDDRDHDLEQPVQVGDDLLRLERRPRTR